MLFDHFIIACVYDLQGIMILLFDCKPPVSCVPVIFNKRIKIANVADNSITGNTAIRPLINAFLQHSLYVWSLLSPLNQINSNTDGIKLAINPTAKVTIFSFPLI